jgi:hypothetical protein
LHGVFFQPIRMLDAIGNTLYTFTHNEFVDTFNIPNGYQLVFRLRFQDRANICDDQTKPGACTTTSFGGASGRWVYHCHILPHAALGMVSEIVTTYKTPPPTTRTVAIDKVGFGAGSVTSLPDALMCGDTCSAGFPEGTVVNLVVAPEPGSYFAGFAGPPDCADGSVTLSADVVCTARFGVGMAPADGSGVVDYVPNFLDLDLDGRGDAVQYSPGLGGATSYLEDGTAPRGAASILLPSGTHPWSAGWTIKSGDFNGDGRSDLFFYDEVLGGWFKGISTTPQGGPVSYSYAGGTWSPGWSVAILDLNGDGLADVFLYNPATGDWYRGTSTGDGTGDFSFSAGRWSPGWQIHQMRLDGDALTDLLLYDPASGMWFRALNDGASGFTFANGTWSPGWQIAPGSYNSDALDDIFLYNSSTGDWYVGMNTGTGWAFTGGRFSPAWTVDTGDFNGDGRTDLFLYNVMTGEWYESLADGAGGWAYVHGSWSPGWEVTVTSFNQDNLADVLLYNPVTGAYFQGETTTPGTFVYAGGTWDVGQSVIATTP